MQYILLIYQGDALERQAALPEQEQKQVYADYQGINPNLRLTERAGLPADLLKHPGLAGSFLAT